MPCQVEVNIFGKTYQIVATEEGHVNSVNRGSAVLMTTENRVVAERIAYDIEQIINGASNDLERDENPQGR